MNKTNSLSERDRIYLDMLECGVLSIREAAAQGFSKYCEVEADHLHNLPSLIGETNEARHAYYYQCERALYLERVNPPTEEAEFALRRYEELWQYLEALQMRT